MNVARITMILIECLGEVNSKMEPREGNEIIGIYGFPIVLKTAKVHEHAAEMIELLKDWPTIGEFGQPVPPLGEEIDYPVAGAVLGDQTHAFMLFAFGKLLDWWDILDPGTMLKLSEDDPMGRMLANNGKISIMGYRPSVAA